MTGHCDLVTIYSKIFPELFQHLLQMASRPFSSFKGRIRKRGHGQDDSLLENDILLNEVVPKQDTGDSFARENESSQENLCTHNDSERNLTQVLHRSNQDAQEATNEVATDYHQPQSRIFALASSKIINSFLGIILAMLAASMLSVSALMVKLATSVPSFEIVFIRLSLQLVFSLPALIFFKDKLIYSWKKSGFLILRGVVGVTSMSLIVYAVKQMNMADARVIFYTNPIYTAIFGRIFLKESITKFDIVATLLSLIGVVLIARPTFLFGSLGESAGSEHVWFPALMAVLSAVLSALSLILVRKLAQEVNARVVVFYFAAVGAVVSLCTSAIFGGLKYPDCGTHDIVYVITTGFIGYFAQLLTNKALTLEKAAVVALIRTVGIAVAFFLQLIFLGVVPSGLSIGGAILVLLCNIVIFIKKYRDQKV